MLASKDISSDTIEPPAYHFETSSSFTDPSWENPNNLSIQQCIIDFTVPEPMQGPVFMYYRLTDFYQNHRQYINSFDSAQLLGNPVSPSGNCGSLRTTDSGLGIYPCGLIANSMFNGNIS